MPGKHQDFRIYEENGRRIVRGLGGYPAEPQQDLRALVRFSAEKYGDATGFKFRAADGGVETRSYRRFAADIDGLGTALLQNGMGGRRIAIISENRYEWSVAFFSIVNGTGIAVPLDKYLPKNELIHLLQRGRCEALFFSNNYLEMVREIADEGTTPVKHFLCLDTLTEGAKAGTADISDIHAWIRAGREALADGDRRFVDTPSTGRRCPFYCSPPAPPACPKGSCSPTGTSWPILPPSTPASSSTAMTPICPCCPCTTHSKTPSDRC